MNPLLIALQYWDGDRDAMVDLLHLLADVQLRAGSPADVLVFRSHEAEPVPRPTMARLAEAFEVSREARCSRRVHGYPSGPNAMWHDLMTQVALATREGRMSYEAVLTIEADSCPVAVDWIDRLLTEWRSSKTAVLGSWSHVDDPRRPQGLGHINGNALFAPDLLLRDSSLYGTPSGSAWDTWHAPALHRLGWRNTGLMRNLYRRETIDDDEVSRQIDDGAVYIHGVRDDSLREWARKKLCTK